MKQVISDDPVKIIVKLLLIWIISFCEISASSHLNRPQF